MFEVSDEHMNHPLERVIFSDLKTTLMFRSSVPAAVLLNYVKQRDLSSCVWY